MGQQVRKTQQKSESDGRAGKTFNPKPQNRLRKPKQIRMGKGGLCRLWDASVFAILFQAKKRLKKRLVFRAPIVL